jgi:periplasmic divalent cation tolerance protein
MDTDYSLVITTVPTEEQATQLAHLLVSGRFAACVQMQTIRSVCRWKGELCAGPECMLMIKTTTAAYPRLEEFIKANHSYETPEIIRIPIAGGSPEYLAWLGENVSL